VSPLRPRSGLLRLERPAAHAALWQHAARLDDPARFIAVQNMTLVFRAAYVALSADADLSPAAVDARAQLLAALGKMR
jgi:2-hydroxychromene-2-carboxylate isomerase